jgi:hypothetical protein
MKITKEDFDAWLVHPVSEIFFLQIQEIASKARTEWNSQSWANESLWSDQIANDFRIACKARSDCAEDILNITFEDEEEEEDAELIGDTTD